VDIRGTVDFTMLLRLRERTRGFFLARADRVPDPVFDWLNERAPRAVAEDVLKMAVARDGTLAYLVRGALIVKRGLAVVGTVPVDMQYYDNRLSGVDAMGDRFLLRLHPLKTIIVSAADASVLAVVERDYTHEGGNWVRFTTSRWHASYEGLPLLNLSTGAEINTGDARLMRESDYLLASADDAGLVTVDVYDRTTTLQQRDADTGAVLQSMPLRQMLVDDHGFLVRDAYLLGLLLHKRTVYLQYRMGSSEDKPMYALNLDTNVIAPPVHQWGSVNVMLDDRTRVNFNPDIQVYTDGVLSHIYLCSGSCGVIRVQGPGRRMWFLEAQNSYSPENGGTLYVVDL